MFCITQDTSSVAMSVWVQHVCVWGGGLSLWGDNVRRDLDMCGNFTKDGLALFFWQVALGGCGTPQNDPVHWVFESYVHAVAGKEPQPVAFNPIVDKEFGWGVLPESYLLDGDKDSAKVSPLCEFTIAVLLRDFLHIGELKFPPHSGHAEQFVQRLP